MNFNNALLGMPTENQKVESLSIFKKTISLASTFFSVFGSLPSRVFAVGILYATGYWRYSPIWFFIAWGLIQYRDQKRIEHHFHQEVTKAVTKRNERLLVLSNVNPPPSWVYFPDKERSEWLNKLVGHLWSSLQPLVEGQLKNVVPAINDVLSKHKKNPNFTFKNVNLGSLTPRVSGVKVNRDVNNSNRIAVDVYVFYVSDGTFKGSVCNMINFGANNFVLKGCLRILISTPNMAHLPGVEVFFLQPPDVNFNLTGILNVADLPGLSGLLRNAINGAIAKHVVLPNKFLIKYDKKVDYDELEFPDSDGLLKINVIAAKDLEGTRRFMYSDSNKKPNPYVIIKYGPKTVTSPAVKNSSNPVWNVAAEFVIDTFIDDTIIISVADDKPHDQSPGPKDVSFLDDSLPVVIDSEDPNLGKLSLSLKLIKNKLRINSWIQLEDVVSGMIHLSASYHTFETNPKIGISNDLPTVLEVFIEEAKNLVDNKENIIAEVSVGDAKQCSRSVPVDKPVFREVFLLPVKNPKTDKLNIKLTKENNKKTFGNAEFDIKQVLEATDMVLFNAQTKINGANESSSLSVAMRLRTMKP